MVSRGGRCARIAAFDGPLEIHRLFRENVRLCANLIAVASDFIGSARLAIRRAPKR